jgi:hypothetical protein
MAYILESASASELEFPQSIFYQVIKFSVFSFRVPRVGTAVAFGLSLS